MSPEDYGILKELVKEFRQEIYDIDIHMDGNLRRIRESEAYIDTLSVSEPEDFKVFSPRRAKTLHKEELQEAQECRLACEEENEKLNRRKELLKGRIRRLEELLDCLEQEEQRQAKEAKALLAERLQRLSKLAEKVDDCGSNMERNPIQARQDLAIIGKCLRELAQ